MQHVALHTKDIFYTLRRMKEASELGGFEFLEPPPEDYYQNLPTRLGSALTHEQLSLAKNYGVLADKDDQGVLLQIFTKPIGDRPTLFFEIIQVSKHGWLRLRNPLHFHARNFRTPPPSFT